MEDQGSAEQAATGYFQVYVRPGGTNTVNDDSDGRSLSAAVGSLHAAQLVLERHNVRSQSVRVWIEQGTYTGQSTYWSWNLDSGYEILFQGDTDARPVFTGCASSDTRCTTDDIPDGRNHEGETRDTEDSFFVSGLSSGSDERFRFERLIVTRYGNGIRLRGQNSSIRNCRFDRIGNGWDNDIDIELEPGYGAVRLSGADRVTVENSTFDRIWNNRLLSNWSGVHAIYLADGANENVIRGNTFTRITGDPVRIRNCSNENVIENNDFARTGANFAVSDWQNDSTTKDEGYSWDNVVRYNSVAGKFNCDSMKVTGYWNYGAGGNRCKPSSSSERFRTSSNTLGSSSSCTSQDIRDLYVKSGDL